MIKYLSQVTRIPVSSSSVRAVGFNADYNVLEVEFQNGRIYRYYGVPASIYKGLLAAPSKGRYVNERIIPETVDAMREFELSVIAPGQSTGGRAVNALANAFGDGKLAPLAGGKREAV